MGFTKRNKRQTSKQDFFDLAVNFSGPSKESAIKSERQKARELRRSNWWQNQIQNATCYYCNQAIPKELVTMDHIIPLSSGGKSIKSNIVCCCKECNTLKKDSSPLELTSLHS